MYSCIEIQVRKQVIHLPSDYCISTFVRFCRIMTLRHYAKDDDNEVHVLFADDIGGNLTERLYKKKRKTGTSCFDKIVKSLCQTKRHGN